MSTNTIFYVSTYHRRADMIQRLRAPITKQSAFAKSILQLTLSTRRVWTNFRGFLEMLRSECTDMPWSLAYVASNPLT